MTYIWITPWNKLILCWPPLTVSTIKLFVLDHQRFVVIISYVKMGTESPVNYEQPSAQVTYVHKPLILGPQSSTVTCPSCHAQVKTRMEIEASTKTHLFALLLCFLCFPCVFIPYCNDSCRSKNHYCPNCTAYLGRYED